MTQQPSTRPPRLDPAGRDRPAAEHAQARRTLWVSRLAVAAILLVMLALLGRVVQLQARPSPAIAALLGTQTSRQALLERRGSLLDRRGRLLAVTRVAQRLFVDPALVIDRGAFPERVAYELGYDPVEIERTLGQREHTRYVVLDQRLDDRRAHRAEQVDLPGLSTEPVLVRDYPQGTLAGQLIGFVGRDGVGLAGLEMALDPTLAAEPGQVRFLRDARRRPLWVPAETYRPQRDGQSVRLALDVTIQEIAQRALAQTVEKYNARSGQLIVMDPVTGEILALANHPTFNPADFATADPQLLRNRAVTDVFEPGSIFKPIVWAGITELGAARPSEKIDCTEAGFWVTPYRRTLRDAHGVGTLTWDGVLVKSSNIGMAKAAERITPEQLHQIVAAFGFGQTTGSNLPGEIEGLVNPLPKWTRYSQSSIPMGQEIGVTAMQMVRAFSAIANDGLLVTPTIRMVDPATDPVVRIRVLSPAVALHTRQVLARVVQEGTGRKAQSEQYTIFGKTGTAQLPNFETGGYHQDRYVSSFVGGAPVDSPRLVVGCFIHDPDRKVGHYGGIVAAPAVRTVVEESLTYLGVPRTPTTRTAAANADRDHAPLND